MKKIPILLFLCASSLMAQVQLGKGVQIGFGGSGGTVAPGTPGQVAQYPANGTTVQGATVSGDATLGTGGALTLSTVNGSPGTCGDSTHVGQVTVNAKGLTTSCTPVAVATGGSSVGSAGTMQAAGATSGQFAAATSSNIQNGIGSGVYVPVNGISNGPIYLFGTSITAGTGSFINGNSYPDILATDSGNNLQAWGIGGAQAADITEQVVRKFPRNSTFRLPLAMGEVFSNDAKNCGNTTGCLANGSEALNAIIGWITIPTGGVINANAATSSGFVADTTTFPDQSLPAIAMKTNTQNSTLTFNFTNAGSQVGIMFSACDAFTSSTFTVTLGGTLVDTINPMGNNGQPISTGLGATCSFFRKEYANSHGTTVSLVIQKTDANTGAAGTVSIWDADTNGAGLKSYSPNMWTLGTIRTDGDSNAAATAAFDALSQTVATQFATDGWNSLYVPMRSGQTGANPGVNDSTDMDNLPPVNPNESVGYHPNSGPGGGHFHYAQTIENFALANGFNYFNVGVSGNHNFFTTPITQVQNYSPANILGYNNFNPVAGPSDLTALLPGGLLTNGYMPWNGTGTFSGIDFGYDASLGSYIGRAFATNWYEICVLPSTQFIPKTQAQFNCGYNEWNAVGDYIKPAGFFRPKGGISYENQSNTKAGTNPVNAPVFNGARGTNVNFVDTAAGGVVVEGLPLCKANTYDYQLWYFKTTGDSNPVKFTAYNSLDTINGQTSGATGTITAYSITSSVITFTETNSFTSGTPVFVTGFPTSTFLNNVSFIVATATGTTWTATIAHANASATETGSSVVNASWTGLTAPYSAALVQCSVGPTGNNTISIAQFSRGDTNSPTPYRYVGTITSVAGTSDALSVTGLTSSNHCASEATNAGAAALTGVYVTPGSGSLTLNHSTSVGGETFDMSCNVP